MKSKQTLINLGLLLLLHALVDKVYVFVYPSVNPFRALFIGATATTVLWLFRKKIKIVFWKGGLAVFSSALFGALLVQAGLVVSKSALSAIAHALILIITYLLFEFMIRKTLKVSRGKR
ncbi:MAG: hypothetical protein Q8R37_06120 [Nanoarchaeota archaeon]|nr:hypothetical protein [Nanoarchaeota archaeon]